MLRILIIAAILLSFNSCTKKKHDLKSPCATLETTKGDVNPCVRRQINDAWIG